MYSPGGGLTRAGANPNASLAYLGGLLGTDNRHEHAVCRLGYRDASTTEHEPKCVELLKGHNVASVHCGGFHTAALTKVTALANQLPHHRMHVLLRLSLSLSRPQLVSYASSPPSYLSHMRVGWEATFHVGGWREWRAGDWEVEE